MRFPGPGWSGSPFIVPETGDVAGLLTNERHRKNGAIVKQRFVMDAGSADIRSLFEINAICYESTGNSILEGNSEKQFRQILHFLEALTTKQNEHEIQIKDLCDAFSGGIKTGEAKNYR